MISPLQKKKLWRLPKLNFFMERWSASPFWPTYTGEKGRTLGKTYGINARCYWEHPWGTHWELVGNKGKNIPPHPKLKRKKNHLALCVHVKPPHWLHKISIFQNYLSPFLAWANTPIINWGFYYFYFFLLFF